MRFLSNDEAGLVNMEKLTNPLHIVDDLLDTQVKISDLLSDYTHFDLVALSFKDLFTQLDKISELLAENSLKSHIVKLFDQIEEFWRIHILTPLRVFMSTLNVRSNLSLLHVKLLIFVD